MRRINGTTLIEQGWPEGPLIGDALALARELRGKGLDETDVQAALDRVLTNPESVAAGEAGYDLAQAVLAERKRAIPPDVRDEPLEAPIWGRELIDPQAIRQLENAMRLPVTVAGALMPDAHVGYGIPIGGVVALENAVAPYMVGVDIACRMMLSVYPGEATSYLENASRRDKLRKTLRRETRFGIGAKFGPRERRDHDVLDDADWNATPLLRNLKDKAHAQLGTSGTGNHFVDVGRLRVEGAGAEALGVEPGTYLGIPLALGQPGRWRDHRGSLLEKGARGDKASERPASARLARPRHRTGAGVLDEHEPRGPVRLGVPPRDPQSAGERTGLGAGGRRREPPQLRLEGDVAGGAR